MSDDDFNENEEFDFEYSGSDEEETHIDLENTYYEAKGFKQNDPKRAIKEFLSIVEQEEEKGEWYRNRKADLPDEYRGFKALKQSVKVSFKMQDYDSTLIYYIRLLGYTKSAVTRNVGEKSINSILDYVSAAQDMTFMEKVYSTTLDSLQEQKNDRLWTKTNLKLAKLWLDRMEYTRLNKIIRQLHQSCAIETNDAQKGTLLLEIYALEIQMYTQTKNNKKLKEVYRQCLHVKSAIPHPKIMGLIRECGGKMHMYEEEWNNAQTDFFEAFKNYDEAGSPQRIQCLKYLVLANMLMESEINPFDSQETKPYANDPQLVVLTSLVHAYQRKDIKDFERILKSNRSSIMDDVFIRGYIDDVLKNIRMQVIVQLVCPYTRIGISSMANELNITCKEAEELLVLLILDGKLAGKIDQVSQIMELDQRSEDSERHAAISKLGVKTLSLCRAVAQR